MMGWRGADARAPQVRERGEAGWVQAAMVRRCKAGGRPTEVAEAVMDRRRTAGPRQATASGVRECMATARGGSQAMMNGRSPAAEMRGRSPEVAQAMAGFMTIADSDAIADTAVRKRGA